MVEGGEHVRFAQVLHPTVHNARDYTLFGVNAEWIYESCWVGLGINSIKFSFWNYYAHHLEYCFGCHSSENLFGCVGIRKGSYCILNKQYSKEDYVRTVGEIKEQMLRIPYVDVRGRQFTYGEFFPIELSPWAYNESMAYDFLSVSKETAINMGFRWREPDKREYQAATVIIPDRIQDVDDSILQAILACETCGRNYRLIRMELDFYRRLQLPIPRRCFFCRDSRRLAQLSPVDIYDRRCAKCGKAIQTSYAPERKEIVYCESCYNSEVV